MGIITTGVKGRMGRCVICGKPTEETICTTCYLNDIEALQEHILKLQDKVRELEKRIKDLETILVVSPSR